MGNKRLALRPCPTSGAAQLIRMDKTLPYGKFAPVHEGSITIRIPADLKEIQRLNRLVRLFGELHEVPDRSLYAVNLALDELLSNVILYGYDDPAGQTITVSMEVRAAQLYVKMEDGGRAFNPTTRLRPT